MFAECRVWTRVKMVCAVHTFLKHENTTRESLGHKKQAKIGPDFWTPNFYTFPTPRASTDNVLKYGWKWCCSYNDEWLPHHHHHTPCLPSPNQSSTPPISPYPDPRFPSPSRYHWLTCGARRPSTTTINSPMELVAAASME
jgi:hypothetical protein